MKRYIAVVNNLNQETNEYLPEWMWNEEIILAERIIKIYKYKSSIGDKDSLKEIFAICYVWFDTETRSQRYFYQKFDYKESRDEVFDDCKIALEIEFDFGG